MKVFVIVDAQNDFITGELGTPQAMIAARRIVDKIKKLQSNTMVLFTKDTHHLNYLETQEGTKLPIKHCIYNTSGWSIDKSISDAVKTGKFYSWSSADVINGRILKETFGSSKLAEIILSLNKVDEIILVGFCTDICVISNALLLKTYLPEVKISVDAECCAGTTPEKHEAALSVMESCQINILRGDNQ